MGLRLVSAIAGVSLLILIGALAAPVRAEAGITHVLQSSFATAGTPLTIAVDEATGSVYVNSQSPSAIEKFTATGVPDNFAAPGGSNKLSVSAPETIAVDNSGGINQGVIYIGRSIVNVEPIIYLPSGAFVTEYPVESNDNTNSTPCGVAVNSKGDFYVAHSLAFLDKFHPGLWLGNASPPQVWPISGTMVGLPFEPCKIAVDGDSAIYLNSSRAFTSGTLLKFPASVFSLANPPSKRIDTGSTQFAIDSATNDVYSDRSNAIARFDSAGVLRELFGTGDFEQSRGVAVNSASSTVYVSVQRAGGVAKKEVRIYKGVVTPDISDVTATGGQTSASLSATIGTAGVGDVTACQVEYGLSAVYGSTAQCVPDASGTPYSAPQDVSVQLPVLEKETTYHYRFTATNANGTTRDIDGTFTTHNVRDLKTEAPSEITKSSASLNGSFTGDGDPVAYKFEWGPTDGYGETVEGTAPGAVGPVTVSEAIGPLETYQPAGDGIYHYRFVATNILGTTVGSDVVFHTDPPDLPGIAAVQVEKITTESAVVSATVNPGNGETIYSVDYGTSSAYGRSTAVSGPVGDDDTDHPVSTLLTGLQPGTTYHYRIVAVNFGGTTHAADQTFTTEALPVSPVSPVVPTLPPAKTEEVQSPSEKPKRCRKGLVKRKGKCVKKTKRSRKKHGGHNSRSRND